MTETPAIYTVAQIAETATEDRRDYDLQRLSRQVATHYVTLLGAGMDSDAAVHLADEFQAHLLSILVGPRRYDFTAGDFDDE